MNVREIIQSINSEQTNDVNRETLLIDGVDDLHLYLYLRVIIKVLLILPFHSYSHTRNRILPLKLYAELIQAKFGELGALNYQQTWENSLLDKEINISRDLILWRYE